MKIKFILIALLLCNSVYCQFTIIKAGEQGNIQAPKLSFDQIISIQNPKKGMIAFDSSFNCLRFYTGTKWICSSQNENSTITNPVGLNWHSEFIQSSLAIDSINKHIYVSGPRNADYGGRIGYYSYNYISKFSFDGNKIWDKFYRFNSENFARAASVIIDNNLNIFHAYTQDYRTNSNIILYKYDKEGIILGNSFIRTTMPYLYTYSSELFTDKVNSIYLTGISPGFLQIDNVNVSGSGIFIAKYNNNLNLTWAKTLPSSNGKIVCKNGNCAFYLNFSGSVTIENNTFNSFGSSDILIGEYNTNGMLIWIKQVGGTGGDNGADIKIDNSDNVFLTGSFSTNASFGGTTLNSIGLEDFFIVKYQLNGNISWVKQGGGNNIDKGVQVEITPSGETLLLGESSSTPISYGTFSMYPTQIPSKFLIKYQSTSGDISWGNPIQNITNFKVNNQNNIYTLNNEGFSKYNRNGLLIYSQINDFSIQDLYFSNSNQFFLRGYSSVGYWME